MIADNFSLKLGSFHHFAKVSIIMYTLSVSKSSKDLWPDPGGSTPRPLPPRISSGMFKPPFSANTGYTLRLHSSNLKQSSCASVALNKVKT